jgi:hypothetical protein
MTRHERSCYRSLRRPRVSLSAPLRGVQRRLQSPPLQGLVAFPPPLLAASASARQTSNTEPQGKCAAEEPQNSFTARRSAVQGKEQREEGERG